MSDQSATHTVDSKKVKGPAIVRTPSGLEYELNTDIEITVPVGSQVWRLEEDSP